MSAPSTPLVAATWAQARMELRLLLRSGESLLVTLGIPLGILVFFSVVDVLPTGAGEPVSFLVPGVLAISVMATALVALSIQTAFERKYGVLKRLGGTPLPRWAFLVAKAAAVSLLVAAQTLLVLAVATFGLGWQPDARWPLAIVGIVVGTATFSALGLLMAGALRAEATLALSNALFLLLLLVSGVMIEADALPASVAVVGGALPSGALGAVLRAALEGGAGWPLGALGVLTAWGAAAGAVAGRTFRWEP